MQAVRPSVLAERYEERRRVMKETERKEHLFGQMFLAKRQGFMDISEKRHFWKDLADELNGTLIVEQSISKEVESLMLQIPYKRYNIKFTESDTLPLKINCKLPINQLFEFSVSYEDSIEKLLKLFGHQDIQVGDTLFDKKYLIQGTDDELVTYLFADGETKAILLSNNVFSFTCSYDKTDRTIQLASLVSRTVHSKSELSELFRLFYLTIDNLEILNLLR